MQTAKIKIGSTYALQQGAKLVRFRVTAISTKRTGNGTYNSVHGIVDVNDDKTPGERVVDPQELLGPFEEQVELVERQRQEKAAQERAEQEKKNRQQELRKLFYKLTGAKLPQKVDDYDQPFRASYGGGIEISDEGVQALLAWAKTLK